MSKSRSNNDSKHIRKMRDWEAVALFARGGREQPHEDKRKAARRKACRKWDTSNED